MDHEQALRRDYFIQKHPAAIVISRHFTHSVHCAAILLFLCGLKQSSICRAEHVELISSSKLLRYFTWSMDWFLMKLQVKPKVISHEN